MLPGAPLDGGRLLHAFLWNRHGDRTRATVSASKAGKFVGYGLIAFGVVELFFYGAFGGIWTALIGYFLVGAATQEATMSVAKDALEGLTVGDVMGPRPLVAPDWLPVAEFIDTYVVPTDAELFVLEAFDGSLSGVVTLDELQQVPREAQSDLRVRGVAQPLEGAQIVDPARPADELYVAASSTPGRTWKAVVVSGGRPVGVVTTSDLARAIKRRRLLGRRAPTNSI